MNSLDLDLFIMLPVYCEIGAQHDLHLSFNFDTKITSIFNSFQVIFPFQTI